MRMKSSGGGEIVQVQGGHIIRSTGRKDRHSKVYTAKGPRDRRVRLAAHTAIQFYDVQDRLGYDRPSKAVDWLIKKAKSSIDKLAELPPWHPTANTGAAAAAHADLNVGSSDIAVREQKSEPCGYGIDIHSNNSSFIPTHLGSADSMVDTMKSFFPTTTNAPPPAISFQNYPPDIISNTANNSQDLCLSLHTFQDPTGEASQAPQPDQTLFSGSGQVGFETNSGGWTDHHPPELGRFQRMVAWSGGGGGGGNGGNEDAQNRGGFVFNSAAALVQQQFLSQQGTGFSQRGPLQSSFGATSSSVRAWDDIPIASGNHQTPHPIHQSTSGFPGFCIPVQIHGQGEHGGVVSDKPSDTSPGSHH